MKCGLLRRGCSRRVATISGRAARSRSSATRDLGARGMNSALAIAGTTAYVGSRIDNKGVAIVDISDPANPTVVGELGAPDEALAGHVVARAARRRRAESARDPEPAVLADAALAAVRCARRLENLRFFDITDRLHPRLRRRRCRSRGRRRMFSPSPHEFFLWRDPQDPARVIVYLAAPGLVVRDLRRRRPAHRRSCSAGIRIATAASARRREQHPALGLGLR